MDNSKNAPADVAWGWVDYMQVPVCPACDELTYSQAACPRCDQPFMTENGLPPGVSSWGSGTTCAID